MTTGAHSIGCEAGWVSLDNYCYWYSEDSTSASSTTSLPSSSLLTLEQASAACQAKGAQLASVTSELENQLAVSLLHTCMAYSRLFSLLSWLEIQNYTPLLFQHESFCILFELKTDNYSCQREAFLTLIICCLHQMGQKKHT